MGDRKVTQQSDFSTDDIVPILSLSDPLGGLANSGIARHSGTISFAHF
jgi:hypothetical protein